MLDNVGVGQITFNGSSSFGGSSSINVVTTRNISLTSGASISVVNGNLRLNANSAGTTTGNFQGILLNGAILITSGTGNIALTGRGGTTGSAQRGIDLRSGSVIQSTSAANMANQGTITLIGTGRGSGAGTNNDGVFIQGAATAVQSTATGSGDITIIGVHGVGASSEGIQLQKTNAIQSLGTANVTLIADRMNFSIGSPAINAVSRTVTLRQAIAADLAGEDNGDAINVGSTADSTTNTLELSDTELDRITAGTLQIGDSTSGTITVSAAISHPNNLSLTSSAGINFNQPVTMASNMSLTAIAINRIHFPNGPSDLAITTTGAVMLTSAKEVLLQNGASITTVNGGIALSGNIQATPTTGDFRGVNVENSLLQSTGSGSITSQGRGGSTGNAQIGVVIHQTGDIIGASSESLVVQGTGGNGTGTSNSGVQVNGVGSTIMSTGASIPVIGQGHNGGLGTPNQGVIVDLAGQISAGGTGTVAVQGTGGVTDGGSDIGVRVDGASSLISSNGGNISITGIAGGSAASPGSIIGVLIFSGAAVTVPGSGSLSITGTGGLRLPAVHTQAVPNQGVRIRSSTTQVSTVDGDLTATGFGGSGVSSEAINLGASASGGASPTPARQSFRSPATRSRLTRRPRSTPDRAPSRCDKRQTARRSNLAARTRPERSA